MMEIVSLQQEVLAHHGGNRNFYDRNRKFHDGVLDLHDGNCILHDRVMTQHDGNCIFHDGNCNLHDRNLDLDDGKFDLFAAYLKKIQLFSDFSWFCKSFKVNTIEEQEGPSCIFYAYAFSTYNKINYINRRLYNSSHTKATQLLNLKTIQSL
jgi:hypothetical protein